LLESAFLDVPTLVMSSNEAMIARLFLLAHPERKSAMTLSKPTESLFLIVVVLIISITDLSAREAIAVAVRRQLI
jgi:hypothetical protein